MWLTKSNRMKHFLYAILCGVILNNRFVCSLAAGIEFKDKMYSDKWDWLDILATLLGALYTTSFISFLHY